MPEQAVERSEGTGGAQGMTMPWQALRMPHPKPSTGRKNLVAEVSFEGLFEPPGCSTGSRLGLWSLPPGYRVPSAKQISMATGTFRGKSWVDPVVNANLSGACLARLPTLPCKNPADENSTCPLFLGKCQKAFSSAKIPPFEPAG